MILKTLQRSGNVLASPHEQLRVLGDGSVLAAGAFASHLAAHGHRTFRRKEIKTLQVNVGKVCNQTCTHCHVDAGPERRESMSRATAEQVIDFLSRSMVEILDITGGAPEMNPNFRWLVEQASALGRRTLDRCNLTILMASGYTDLPDFFAAHCVTVIASLPCYLEKNCDAQRGNGVFGKSIEALRCLNQLGYGAADSGLELNLVYNPVGTGLPPPQAKLESDYREQLRSNYGVEFNHLFTITNMPISRYLDDLLRSGEYRGYMEKLVQSFNPATMDDLMCRSMISVDWRGYVYDCDFNQMLDLQIEAEGLPHISQLQEAELAERPIRTANHCFGCTAGHGSSCQGSIAR